MAGSVTRTSGMEQNLSTAINKGCVGQCLVFFDLETTGLITRYNYPDIVQIAAVGNSSSESFCRYIVPQQPMTQKAIELTGFHVSGDALLLGGKLMKTHTLRQALQDFLVWLGDQLAEQDKVLLLAYNGQRFDVPILLDSLRKCGLETEAKRCIGKCADILKMVRESIPVEEVGDYRLETLTRKYLPRRYKAHNAVGDAMSIRDLFDIKLSKVIDINLYTFEFC